MTSDERKAWLDDMRRASSWLYTLQLMGEGHMGMNNNPDAIASWAKAYKRECDDRIAVLAEAEQEQQQGKEENGRCQQN